MFRDDRGVSREKKADFVSKAQAERERRRVEGLQAEEARRRERAVARIQPWVRGCLVRGRLVGRLWGEIEEVVQKKNTAGCGVLGGEELYWAVQKGIWAGLPGIWGGKGGKNRGIKKMKKKCKGEVKESLLEGPLGVFLSVCECVLEQFCGDSSKADSATDDYVSLVLKPDYNTLWMKQIKALSALCIAVLTSGRHELYNARSTGHNPTSSLLRLLVVFTNSATWRFVQRNERARAPCRLLCANILRHLVVECHLYRSLGLFCRQALGRTGPGGGAGGGSSKAHGSYSRRTGLGVLELKAACTLWMAGFSICSGNVQGKGSGREEEREEEEEMEDGGGAEVTISRYNPLSNEAFVLSILTVPSIVHILTQSKSDDVLGVFKKNNLKSLAIDVLSMGLCERNGVMRNSLSATQCLAVAGNIIELEALDVKEGKIEISLQRMPSFVGVLLALFGTCCSFQTAKKSEKSTYNCMLGFMTAKVEDDFVQTMADVMAQISMLWSDALLSLVVGDIVLEDISKLFIKKKPYVNPESMINMNNSCKLFKTAMRAMPELRVDILKSLSYCHMFVPKLWQYFIALAPSGGEDILLKSAKDPAKEPLIYTLALFVDCLRMLCLVLDEHDLYEEEKPLTLETLTRICQFMNSYCFQVLWHVPGCTSKEENVLLAELVENMAACLKMLFEKDARRTFVTNSADIWTSQHVKKKAWAGLIKDRDAKVHRVLKYMPHAVPFSDRLTYFTDMKTQDRMIADASDREAIYVVRIFRNRILESGFEQLMPMPGAKMRNRLYVRFVNLHGIEEEGIDQNGVFKEFLEETCSALYDPNFNLFQVTADQRLYPSVSSSVQPDHLKLFEYCGRIAGKAAYEGILLDIPFAQFFLSKILGAYSFIDELPSLDPDLYRNLMFLKHYDGDCEDLGLTFSIDTDVFGKIETTELVPGGSAKAVTNDSKLWYMYLMADFRLNKQFADKSKAFVKGFKDIIKHEWLAVFSPSELRKVIAGDNNGIDFKDLRRNTKYINGYHDSHSVVKWLWDCVSEFSGEDQGLFLKFVTSCSKPPLLGFSSLQPPFQIQAVAYDEGEHTEVTATSTIKNFFGISGSDTKRLPTSSTCFNLLKLPMYKKKKTLKERLLYAIRSKAGFELA
eukprot:Nk52_evm9s316 gene=Nk52_evmTU9s316